MYYRNTVHIVLRGPYYYRSPFPIPPIATPAKCLFALVFLFRRKSICLLYPAPAPFLVPPVFFLIPHVLNHHCKNTPHARHHFYSDHKNDFHASMLLPGSASCPLIQNT